MVAGAAAAGAASSVAAVASVVSPSFFSAPSYYIVSKGFRDYSAEI